MSDDILRLILIAAVVLIAYQVLKDGKLIKNMGVLTTETEGEQNVVQSEQEQAEQVNAEQVNAEQEHSEMNTEHNLSPSSDGRLISSQIQDDVYKNNTNTLPRPQISNSFSPQGNFEPNSGHNFAQLDCFPKDQTQPKDLLPTDGGFPESNPAPQGQLMNRNLFESGHYAGLNTQSSTLKNANLQLRSDPLIPRRDVGPWNQSTYESDTNRRAFEIGTA
jgi:hypothetical protein